MNNIQRLAIFVIVSTFLCSHVMAQEKFRVGEQVVCSKNFKVSFGKINPNTMVVVSRLPQYKKGYPRPTSSTPPLPIRQGDMKVDTLVDKSIVFEVLKDKLEKLKNKDEKLTIRYVFGQDGSVVDISSYNLHRNTLVTPEELALIDKQLRKEVKVTFKGQEYLQWPVIFFGREIQF